MQRYADFVFIDAPHKLISAKSFTKDSKEQNDPKNLPEANDKGNGQPSTQNIEDESGNERSWWFNVDNQTFKGTNKNGPAYGFDVSLRCVEDAWKTQGPFHGLLGFSQGACFVGLICNLSMRGSRSRPIKKKMSQIPN